jgi:hypothetical protein
MAEEYVCSSDKKRQQARKDALFFRTFNKQINYDCECGGSVRPLKECIKLHLHTKRHILYELKKRTMVRENVIVLNSQSSKGDDRE